MKAAHKRPWLPADDRALKATPSHAAGIIRIALQLNRTPDACRARLSFLRNENRPLSSNDIAERSAERERDGRYVAKVLKQGGFPVIDFAKRAWLWPTRKAA